MSFDVNDLDNEVGVYMRDRLRDTEEWRRTHASGVLPAKKRMTVGALLRMARAAGGRATATAGELVGTFQACVARSSEPSEECC
jgi:hypothetical protein